MLGKGIGKKLVVQNACRIGIQLSYFLIDVLALQIPLKACDIKYLYGPGVLARYKIGGYPCGLCLV